LFAKFTQPLSHLRFLISLYDGTGGNKDEVEKIKQQIDDIWEKTRAAAMM
jgi:hypothetical protein